MKTLIDSSVWIPVLKSNSDSKLTEIVSNLILNDEACICGMILLELSMGFRNAKEKSKFHTLLESLYLLDINNHTFQFSSELAYKARRAGITVPSSDLLIFACSKIHDVSLLHQDKHFDLLESVV